MYLERNFDVTIQISNPISFCTNKLTNALIELKNQYENKCFQGSYIISIINILQISSCRIIDSNSSAEATMDIKFLASIYIVNEWEIIVKSKIIKDHPLVISNYKENNMEVSITFKPTTVMPHMFLIGQYVPIRIIKAIHKPKTNQIIAAGTILTCDTKADIYKISNDLSKSHTHEINQILNNIKLELQKRISLMKVNSQRILFFEKMLYSYKNIQSNNIKKYNIINSLEYENYEINYDNMISIFDINNQNINGYWHRPLNMFRSSPYIIKIDSKDIKTDSKDIKNYTETLPHIMIISYAKQILSFLQAIRELVEIYDENLIKSHENIWDLIRLKQI